MNAITPSRPKTVTVAVLLFLLVLIVGLISSFYQSSHSEAMNTMAEQMPYMKNLQFVIMSVVFVVELFFLYKIFQGRNWARITMLVLFIIGALLSIPTYLGAGGITIPATSKIIGSIGLVVELVAFILIFTGPGDAFFRKRTH